MEREVIIVGAGPAGATTAIALVRLGRDVLLLDRQLFPRDKACGDAIPGGAIEVLNGLGMAERIADAGFHPVHRLLLSSPNQFVLEANLRVRPDSSHSYVVPRTVFDHLLQQYAVDCGADFCQALVQEPLLENGRVVGVRTRLNGKQQDIRAKVVVGADGVTSVIGRAVRREKLEEKHRAVALRAYISDLEVTPAMVEFYLYKGILPGYAWIFPTGQGQANIGLGMRLDHFRKQADKPRDWLDRFLALPVLQKRLGPHPSVRDVSTWQMNFGSQKKLRRAYPGALLVGDAGSMINPLTGGGIGNAVLAGRLAGELIHAALHNAQATDAILQQFDRLCHEAMWDGMKRSYFLQRTLLSFPLWVDGLIRFGQANSQLAQTFIGKL
jgi:menaquinone-9 beta-reductase